MTYNEVLGNLLELADLYTLDPEMSYSMGEDHYEAVVHAHEMLTFARDQLMLEAEQIERILNG